MSKKFISKDSHTDWEHINTTREEDINMSDIPEVTKDQIARAKLRLGGRSIPKEKIRVNILLDANVVAYFKTLAAGRGYQTLINEALKNNILHHDIETSLRRIIREELQN